MRRAAIVSPLRTPVGKFGGNLRALTASDLASAILRAVVDRSKIDPNRIDDVVFAQAYPSSEAPCIGRYAALDAGLPESVPGFQIDRRCGGGLQAVATAAMMVQVGAADVVVAGGVESMSNAEHYTTEQRWGSRMGHSVLHDRLTRGRERSQPEWRYGLISGMVETAENIAAHYQISREEADAYAANSQQRASAARQRGAFDEELVPLHVPQRKGDPILVNEDEGIRPDTNVGSLARLPSLQEGGTVTAGNASQQNDAASACLVVSADALEPLELEPLAFVKGWSAAGCDPAMMGLGPVPATERVLSRTGLTLDDMDLIEINEAFACQVLGVLREWDFRDQDKLNVNGSGISLGHPIAATGVRILTTMLHEMRRRGGRYALETMCIGGGQGLAAVFEMA